MKRQRSLFRSTYVLAAFLATGTGIATGDDGVPESVRATETASSGRHDDCVRDEECVAMTSLKQVCRHVDPAATDVCPAVNRKYAAFFESVSCYTNTGCRPIADIACRQGVCTGTVAD